MKLFHHDRQKPPSWPDTLLIVFIIIVFYLFCAACFVLTIAYLAKTIAGVS
jgi:hypothetical protein